MYHILAADIGGTHCRLAYFTADSGFLLLKKSCTLPTAQVLDTHSLLDAYARELCPPSPPLQHCDMLVLAIAGPLLNSHCARTSNAALELDMRVARARGVQRTLLCNDFVAQAWSCLSPVAADAVPLLPRPLPLGSRFERPKGKGRDDRERGQENQDRQATAQVPPNSLQPIGIIGAGTGLGAAALQPLPQGGYGAFASEFGHMPFAFSGGQGQATEKNTERAYEDFLRRILHLPYVSADTVLSGRGLCLLHQFLHGEKLEAATIAAQHLQADSLTCRYFSTFFGRMCRQWALTCLCTGGLYITGGLAVKNPVLVQCPAFGEAFYDAKKFTEYLHTVPVFLHTRGDSGLWGAAWAGLQALKAAPKRAYL